MKCGFMSEIVLSDKLLEMLKEVSRDLAMRAVMECGREYNFSGEEAIRKLGLCEVNVRKVSKVSKVSKSSSNVKVVKSKSVFPFPFMGVLDESCCHGLRINHGLYTQCQNAKCEGGVYCKKCGEEASKNESGKPDIGTVEDRLSVGLYEFKDAKGKSPVAYTKLMKKLNISKEEVELEAWRLGYTIPSEHFEVCALQSKRGRPKSAKVEKEAKGSKGRPKKAKKVLELEGDEEDLFSALVAKANADVSDEVSELTEVTENESKKSEKESKKKAEKEAKEAEKEAKKKAKEAEKDSKKSKSVEVLPVAVAVAVDVESSSVETKEKESVEEPDVVKRIDYEGKKYLKSKKTGIIYNMDQEVVGRWNDSTKMIDFMEEEECESDYEE